MTAHPDAIPDLPHAAAPCDREHLFGRLLLGALPLVLVTLNQTWMLNATDQLDSWVYYGYFTNPHEYLRAFAGTYYGSRLSWIFPGAIAHALLGPMAANYVLHLAVYYAALFSIYFTLRRLAGTRAALVAALFVGCYGYFLAAVGWDYVDGPGLAYYAAALACLTAAIDSRRRRLWVAAAGAAFAGAFHTNVVWTVMLPALACFYFVTTRSAQTGRPLTDWLYAGLGAVVMTLGIGVAAAANGAAFWFFAPSLAFALNGATTPASVAAEPSVLTFLARARFHIFPVAVLVLAVCVRVARRGRDAPLVSLLADHYVLMYAGLLTFDMVAGGSALRVSFYTSYVLPGMALAVGLLVRDPVRALSPRQFAVAVGVAAIVLAGALHPAIANRLAPPQGYRSLGLVSGSVVLVLLAGVLTRLRTSLATFLVLVISAAFVNVTTLDVRVWQRDRARPDEAYRATVAASEALMALDPDLSARLWYSAEARFGDVFTSVAATRLWGYRLFGDRFPSLMNSLTKQKSAVAPGDRIVVLAPNRSAVSAAQAALHPTGLDTTVVAERDIAEGEVRFHLWLLRVGIDPALLDATPLPVSNEVFGEGSWKGLAERAALDPEDGRVRVLTNRSTYDWQFASRPIALGAGRYLAEFDVQVPRGGAGFHVVTTEGQRVLGSRYWCAPVSEVSRQQLVFETATDERVMFVLSNCGTAAVVSEFAVGHLQLWRYRQRH